MKALSDMGSDIQRKGSALIQSASAAEPEIRRPTREIADATDWLRHNHDGQANLAKN